MEKAPQVHGPHVEKEGVERAKNLDELMDILEDIEWIESSDGEERITGAQQAKFMDDTRTALISKMKNEEPILSGDFLSITRNKGLRDTFKKLFVEETGATILPSPDVEDQEWPGEEKGSFSEMPATVEGHEEFVARTLAKASNIDHLITIIEDEIFGGGTVMTDSDGNEFTPNQLAIRIKAVESGQAELRGLTRRYGLRDLVAKLTNK